MEFNKDRYKIYTWKNWLMLHWILNPGIAIGELILGQRVPKVMLEDKTIDKPRIERTFVPCPHCETVHDSRTWAKNNGTAFKNWFGLYCRNCDNIIPCLTNGFSFLILALTFPIWGWFRRSMKAKWLEKQPKRYENIDLDHVPNSYEKKTWVKTGLSWGAFMFGVMSIIFPYIEGKKITLLSLGLGLVIWSFCGLMFGYSMNVLMNKKINEKTHNS